MPSGTSRRTSSQPGGLCKVLGLSKAERLAGFYRELDYPHDERAALAVAGGLIAVMRATETI
jgi:hypothetical protein